MLTCSADYHMAILALKSLLRFSSDFRVVVHGDPSLDHRFAAMLSDHIPNARFVSSSEADRIAENSFDLGGLRRELPDRFSLSEDFRYRGRAWAMKSIDLHLTAKSKSVVLLDSDTLFLNEPDEFFQWAAETTGSFYTVPYWPNLRVPAETVSKVLPGLKAIEKFNAGFIGYRRDELDHERVVRTIENVCHSEIPIFSDECIWRYLLSSTNATEFPFSRYPLFGDRRRYRQNVENEPGFRYVHFLLKHESGIYRKFAQQVVDSLGRAAVSNEGSDR
ncbi:hypothetical protein [Roseiconus lacunae]|uniref:hypothetical protein n=1 Tax=Roseiconus lacunae TaxID=2605694 RepID=UPI001E568BAD|nr:hypothetical protein [Roseiconus lacunae]MCD0458890.1 hypothetical protein [Roseiconus lacunae]